MHDAAVAILTPLSTICIKPSFFPTAAGTLNAACNMLALYGAVLETAMLADRRVVSDPNLVMLATALITAVARKPALETSPEASGALLRLLAMGLLQIS